ncbi:MAG: hypothetical protein V3V61_04025, partial [Gammaproteobacteria bacterium]
MRIFPEQHSGTDLRQLARFFDPDNASLCFFKLNHTLHMIYQQRLSFRLPPQKADYKIMTTMLWLTLLILVLLVLWRLFSDQNPQTRFVDLPPLQDSTSSQKTAPPWHKITVQPGDSLATLFNKHDLSAQSLQQILAI